MSLHERMTATFKHTVATGHASNERSDEYDAYYCLICNEWIEPKCSDADCAYCAKRPATPP